MIIYLNNIEKNIEGGTLQKVILEELQHKIGDYAVAVNETFVPRSHYAALELQNGDRIELLVPMQGG